MIILRADIAVVCIMNMHCNGLPEIIADRSDRQEHSICRSVHEQIEKLFHERR